MFWENEGRKPFCGRGAERRQNPWFKRPVPRLNKQEDEFKVYHQARRSVTAILILLTMLLSLSSCGQSRSGEAQSDQNAAAETAGDDQILPAADIIPGSIAFTTSGGEYWGLMGAGKPSPGKVLYDYVSLKMSSLVKVGYNIQIDVADKLENLSEGKEIPEGGISVDDYLKEIAADKPAVKKQIIVIYIGESNEIAVYAGEDIPKTDFDAVKAAFQDEAVSDPVLRVMIGVKALYDELLSAEGLAGG